MLRCKLPLCPDNFSQRYRERSFAVITQMHVKGLMFDPYNNAYIVVLRDEDRHEMLPIWVGKVGGRRDQHGA